MFAQRFVGGTRKIGPNSSLSFRKFLQPQWVFDSFNARRLLPIDNYKPGSKLPAHLSPFVEERYGDYIPLERIEQLKSDGKGNICFVQS